jgi:V-type H+-transporting ATPase subunit a
LNEGKTALQRNYVNEVKRMDELERKIRYLMELMKKCKIRIPEEYTNGFGDDASSIANLESFLEEREMTMKELNKNKEALDRNFNELVELKYVLEMGYEFFEGQAPPPEKTESAPEDYGSLERGADYGLSTSLLDAQVDAGITSARVESVSLGFVTGVILRSKIATFERVLFRATRGNLFMNQADIDTDVLDPSTGEVQEKTVFIVFYSGERSRTKITKICESFGANIYQCPADVNERIRMKEEVNGSMSELASVLATTHNQQTQALVELARDIRRWKTRVMKEKAVYHVMNMFKDDVTSKCLIGVAWCPKENMEDIQRALRSAQVRSGASVPSILSVIEPVGSPPAFFRTNRFTKCFQGMVDAYGVANYKEANPMVFSIATFPFLFAVMFGDVGHGTLLTMIAAWLCVMEVWWEGKKLNDIAGMLYQGRWVLLLMGFGAIYTGWIYNECFAMPISILPSGWVESSDGIWSQSDKFPKTYLFGVDYAWKGKSNELTFVNSFKMKISILYGVSHMLMGLAVKLTNGIYFRDFKKIFCEFIWEVLLMVSLFGYLSFLIILKWLIPWNTAGNYWSGRAPPSLINVMIHMFLNPGPLMPEADQLYPGQQWVQLVLLIIAVICVPVLLLAKPIVIIIKHYALNLNPLGLEEGERFPIDEVFIYQLIHAIEYVLGTISNTASYLRLWALSLAHSELAIVFWNLLLALPLTVIPFPFGFIGLFIAVPFFIGATMGVLLVMETLSAYLHALRLHWVEFQNKFYGGSGVKFAPFSFSKLVRDAVKAEDTE